MNRPQCITDEIIKQHWEMLRGQDEAHIAAAFQWVQRLTGVTVSPACYAPSGIGIEWIRRIARRDWLRPLASTEPRWRTDADLTWLRPLSQDELGMSYVHVYDANAAYPAVVATNELAVGEPVKINDFRPNTRSIYFARVHPHDSAWNGAAFPSPLHNHLSQPRTAEGWWYEPQIRFALDQGWAVEVMDGWLFPETHAVLRTWGNEAWAVREQVKTGPVISAMIKAIIKRGMGMMDSEKIAGRDGYRPDWWGWIKSENRRRRMQTIVVQRHDNGAVPYAIDIDAMVFCSNEPDPAKACPVVMRKAASLGGYKHVRTVRNPGQIDARSANLLVTQLKKLEAVHA